MPLHEKFFRQVGSFAISQEFLFKYEKEIMALMGKCIILRTEHIFFQGTFEYYAYSPEFEETEVGTEPPTYIVVAVADHEGNVSLQFVKEK